MKNKELKKILDLNTVINPEIQEYEFSIMRFNEKKSELAKKINCKKQVLENIFQDLQNFNLFQLQEIINFNGPTSEESKALIIILQEQYYKMFGNIKTFSSVANESFYKREVHQHYLSLSANEREIFDDTFHHTFKVQNPLSSATLEFLKQKFKNEELAILLYILRVKLKHEYKKNIIVIYDDIDISSNDIFTIDDLLTLDYPWENVLLPNGKNLTRTNLKKLFNKGEK